MTLGGPGALEISTTIIVNGRIGASGPISIDAAPMGDRHFDVTSTGRLELRDLHLTGGDAGSGDGGAIRNAGQVLLTMSPTGADPVSMLSGNRAANGGAIANSGTVEVRNDSAADEATMVRIHGNESTGAGGTFWNSGTLSVEGSSVHQLVVDSSAAPSGGGLSNVAGTSTVSCGVTVMDTRATRGAGADVPGGTLELGGGLFYLNHAVESGGGVHVGPAGRMSVVESEECPFSRISSPQASGADGAGGAIAVEGHLEVAPSTRFTIDGSGTEHTEYGGAIAVIDQGVVEVDGLLEITRFSAGFGGGIHVAGAGATVTTGEAPAVIEVRDSSATTAGGGISVAEGELSGRFWIDGNSAPEGGGIVISPDDDGGGTGAHVDLVQSRVTRNLATVGAAIHLGQANSAVSATNTSIVANTSDSGGVVVADTGGMDLSFVSVIDNAPIGIESASSVRIAASLLTHNGDANCAGGSTQVVGGAYNLASDTTCHPTGTDHDVPDEPETLRTMMTDLGVGGYWLELGHPAIDGVGDDPATGTCAGLTHDQTAQTMRPQDGDADGAARCDIGAVEVGEPWVEEDRVVSGAVVDETTGRGIAGACVIGVDPDIARGGTAVTDASGRWSFVVPDGSYLVGFLVPSEPVDPSASDGCTLATPAEEYQAEWYGNVVMDHPVDGSHGELDEIARVVVAGADVPGVDACLGPGPGAAAPAPCPSVVELPAGPTSTPGASAGTDPGSGGPGPQRPLAFVG